MKNTKDTLGHAKTLRHKTRLISHQNDGYRVYCAVVGSEVIAQPSLDGTVDNDYVMLTAIVTSLSTKKESDPGLLTITAQRLRSLDRPRIMSSETLPDRGQRSFSDCVRSGFYKAYILAGLGHARVILMTLHEEKQFYGMTHDL